MGTLWNVQNNSQVPLRIYSISAGIGGKYVEWVEVEFELISSQEVYAIVCCFWAVHHAQLEIEQDNRYRISWL